MAKKKTEKPITPKRGRPKGSKNKPKLRNKGFNKPKATEITKLSHPFFGASIEEQNKMIVNALLKTNNQISLAAQSLQIDRTTLSRYIANDPYLIKAEAEISNLIKDKVVDIIYTNALSGSTQEQFKYINILLQYGKLADRGFVKQTDTKVEVNNNFKYEFQSDVSDIVDVDFIENNPEPVE